MATFEPPPSVSVTSRPAKRFGPGKVLPALLAATALLDGGLRLVPLERFAFRAWEPLTISPAPSAVFAANKKVDLPRCWGDLPNLGNYPEDRRYHREAFSTDPFGFRRSAGLLPGEKADAVLFGDSQAAGCGVSDDETLASRLFLRTGRKVFNAAARNFSSIRRIREICRLAHLERGVVLYLVNEKTGLPPIVEGRASPLEAHAAPATPSWTISRLGIVASRGVRRVEASLGVHDITRVTRATLRNGESILFLNEDYERPLSEDEARIAEWSHLHEELAKDGQRLLVVFLPLSGTVYRPLCAPSVPTADR
ncbi:MAG TPA: hypothetical protein VGR00_02065, partial [Thermoanaerobaculia bacterium]|nr:hypothetical protein [Thermoanaerobaculia bacterium]